MPMPAEDIIAYIKKALPDAQVTIKDLAGDGDHYAATVVSSAFEGLSMVRQHQMVYTSLQGHMGTTLHALALETKTPEA
jgi:stress-induced morphogen